VLLNLKIAGIFVRDARLGRFRTVAAHAEVRRRRRAGKQIRDVPVREFGQACPSAGFAAEPGTGSL